MDLANVLKRAVMKLDAYLKREDLTPFTFGPLISVHPMTVYRYLRGTSPTIEIARRIIKVTKGDVTLDDLIPDEVG